MNYVKEAELADNFNSNTFDVQNNQYDKSNVDEDDFELSDFTKYKDDNTRVCVICSPYIYYNIFSIIKITYLPYSYYVAIVYTKPPHTDSKYSSFYIGK